MGSEGGSFPEALDRCIAYIKEGGADYIWLNNVTTRDELREACAKIPAPVLALWGGPQPGPNTEELRSLGVRVAMYPTIAASAAVQAAWQILNELKDRGSPAIEDWAKSFRTSKWGPASSSDLVGASFVREIEERYIPDELQRDYETTFGHNPVFEKPES
jgi:2-methylisocitrate lyase-like PEP mutase family enzyme